MAKRRGLGRGLDSLISSSEVSALAEGGGLTTVPIGNIGPNPHQPRGSLDEDGLLSLAQSIRDHGLIQPLVVRKADNDRYTLIAGERRWRAAKMAGLQDVPVVIKEATSQEMLELALVENIQRADLNPIEEAEAYRHLIDDFGLTQEDVAGRVGKSRSTVANIVRLLSLPDAVKAAVVEGRISGAHARALLPLQGPEVQIAIMKNIIKQGLNVRQTEAIVKKMIAGERPQRRKRPVLSPEMVALESRFSQSLGTRVNIQKGANGGKVVIHFYSDEELQAIYETIVGEE